MFTNRVATVVLPLPATPMKIRTAGRITVASWLVAATAATRLKGCFLMVGTLDSNAGPGSGLAVFPQGLRPTVARGHHRRKRPHTGITIEYVHAFLCSMPEIQISHLIRITFRQI